MSNEGASFSEGESVVVDFNDVEDSAFEALPKGMYNCRVDELTYDISQNSGNPMWTWILEVEDGDFAGRKLFFHTVFAGKGLPRTKKVLQRVAPKLLEGPLNPEEVANSGSMIDLRIRARVDIRKYEGEDRNNVRDLFPPEEGGFAG